MENQIFELVDYDPIWQKIFSKEEQNLSRLLRGNLVTCHHIGSTAIQSIKARPVMDIICEVHSLDGITLFENEFKKVGFILQTKIGEVGSLHYKRFAQDEETVLTDIKIFDGQSHDLINYKNFTDYMVADTEEALKYEEFKQSLLDNPNFSLEQYGQAKKMYFQKIINIIEGM